MGKIKEILNIGSISNRSSSSHSADDLIRDRESSEVSRAKATKVKLIRLEDEVQISDYEERIKDAKNKTVATTGRQPITEEDIATAERLAEEKDPVKRALMTSIVASMRNPSKGGGGMDSSSSITPFLIAQMTSMQKDGKSTEDITATVVNTIKQVKEITRDDTKFDITALFREFREFAKPNNSNDNPILTKFMDKAIEKMGEAPRKSFIEEALTDPGKVEMLEKITGGQSIDKLNLLREMKNDDKKWTLLLKKMDEESKLKYLEIQSTAQRGRAIEKGLSTIIGAAAEALGEDSEVLGMESDMSDEVASDDQTPTPSKKGGKSDVQRVKCDDCNTVMVYVPGKSNDVITCSKCGSKYQMKEASDDSTKPEET